MSTIHKKYSTFPKSFISYGLGSNFQKGALILLLFIDEGVKVNKEYYLETILKGHLMENETISMRTRTTSSSRTQLQTMAQKSSKRG